VREILWRLRPYSKPLRQEGDAIVSVLAADSISPGAKELLKEEGIGYLLHHHREWIGGQALAQQAHVSPATASQVLSELERLEFVESRGQGPHKQRHVTQPGALLDSWVKQLAVKRAPALRRYFVPALKADNLRPLAQTLAAQAIEYAISYEAAAQRGQTPFRSILICSEGRAARTKLLSICDENGSVSRRDIW
jgi:hypothetical protein